MGCACHTQKTHWQNPYPCLTSSYSFCLLFWGAFSIYGLFAFSVGNEGLRRCYYRLVKTHIDPENANSYSCLRCLRVQRKVNLIEAWSRNFFFRKTSSRRDTTMWLLLLSRKHFVSLQRNIFFFVQSFITPTLYLFSEDNRWERIK